MAILQDIEENKILVERDASHGINIPHIFLLSNKSNIG